MKGKNKPDNLEKFFQRVLGEYEEDPGEAFWDRIVSDIPQKPAATTFVYKGWMLFITFLGGLFLSGLFFYGQSNTQLLSNLETQLIKKNTQIETLEQEILALQVLKDAKEVENYPDKTITETISRDKGITQQKTVLSSKYIGFSKKAKPDNTGTQIDKEPFIKLEIARKTGVVATVIPTDGSWLQPRYLSTFTPLSSLFLDKEKHIPIAKSKQLLFDNQLITTTFFERITREYIPAKVAEKIDLKQSELSLLSTNKELAIVFDENKYELSLVEKAALFSKSKKRINENTIKYGPTSFIVGSINPFSSYKYNLAGYKPRGLARLESAGIGKSWNWSLYGGFETKSGWSVQMGIDFNKLTIIKESINNIRFKQEEVRAVNGGSLYSFTQLSDAALGQIIVSSTIVNQFKNDGQDVLDGDLFQLSINTEQPVKIIRVPIMGVYRFDLSKRFYVTPKLGVSTVWKIKDQTELREIKVFSDRLSLQNSDIFLTTRITTESLEANFRTEFGYRWRKRWYLVAEPRFKYGKSLFKYKKLELKDSPFHLMLGIRFNVD